MRRRTIAGVLLAGAALAATGLYVLRLSLLEHVEFGRNSLPFFVLIDRGIADFPLLGRGSSPVHYDHAPQDGLSPRRIGVSFRSALKPDALAEAYPGVCRDRGWRLADERSSRADLICRRGDEVLLLAFRAEGEGSAVRLTFEQDESG
jgi:hypothetical protein